MGCASSNIIPSNNPKYWTTPESFQQDFPLVLDSSQNTTVSQLIAESCPTKGGRAYMEDIDILFPKYTINSSTDIALYGVFDGHGGKECAAYVAKFLPIRLFSKLISSKSSMTNANMSEILYRTFLSVDSEWIANASSNGAGTTATVFLWNFHSSTGILACAGDSRAVLCRQGQAIDMSVDHKATDADVSQQVLANGGFISNDRINGILAVGRGFGDNYLKKPQSKANLLSCAPDLVTYIPQKSDTFIVIASDGLWDVYTSEEVVEKIHAFLGESNIYTELSGNEGAIPTTKVNEIKAKIKAFSYQLARSATQNRSAKDNITILIILLVKLSGSL